ncbi:MAG: hypothetical protein ACRDHZ_05450 [Ktedonobacteraceae bacterium]
MKSEIKLIKDALIGAAKHRLARSPKKTADLSRDPFQTEHTEPNPTHQDRDSYISSERARNEKKIRGGSSRVTLKDALRGKKSKL